MISCAAPGIPPMSTADAPCIYVAMGAVEEGNMRTISSYSNGNEDTADEIAKETHSTEEKYNSFIQ